MVDRPRLSRKSRNKLLHLRNRVAVKSRQVVVRQVIKAVAEKERSLKEVV